MLGAVGKVLLYALLGGVALVIGVPLGYLAIHILMATVTFPAATASVKVSAAFNIDGREVTLDRVVACKPARSKVGENPLSLNDVTVMRLDRPDIGWRLGDGSALIIRPDFMCEAGSAKGYVLHQDQVFRLLWLDDADQPSRIELFDATAQPLSNARIRFLGLDLMPAESRERVEPEPDMAFIPSPEFPGKDRDYVTYSGIHGTVIDDGPVLENAEVRAAMAAAKAPTIITAKHSEAEHDWLWRRLTYMQGYSKWPDTDGKLFPLRLENGALHPAPAEPATAVLYRSRDLFDTPCTIKPQVGSEEITEPVAPNPDALTPLVLTAAQRAELDCAHYNYRFVTLDISGVRLSVPSHSDSLVYDPTRKTLFAFTPGSGYMFESLSLAKTRP